MSKHAAVALDGLYLKHQKWPQSTVEFHSPAQLELTED